MGLDGRVAGGAVRVSTMGGLRGDALTKRRPRAGGAVTKSPALCAYGFACRRPACGGSGPRSAMSVCARARGCAARVVLARLGQAGARVDAQWRRSASGDSGGAELVRAREPGAGRW